MKLLKLFAITISYFARLLWTTDFWRAEAIPSLIVPRTVSNLNGCDRLTIKLSEILAKKTVQRWKY